MSNCFKYNSNSLKLDSVKKYLSELEHFEIKYGWKGCEIRNNFPYSNFIRFRMEFELKFRKGLGVEIQCNLMEFSWKSQDLMNLEQESPV
jgi:hypothetical protein